ncbi:alpha/beta hydrolase [Palleronia sp. KMU-117]|uniref:alpha/beta hydrolase n=1 Tax=Palleronia sp. KMU-117 TaxID=3434108 RepID=UPI003D71A88F
MSAVFRSLGADLVRFACASALVVLVAACGRPPEIIGIENREVPVEAIADLDRHRVFMVTTREASSEVGALYGPDRSADLGLASVDVTVPPTHVVGELERPDRLPPDPRTEFAIVQPAAYATDAAFVAAIDRELAKRPRGKRTLLLFIHGYNTSTTDAILRLGQFVEDTGFEGVPVLFSWASAARTPLYVYDLNSALVARSRIKDLTRLLGATKNESVDVFAHSMGTFLTMEGLVDAQLSGTLGTQGVVETVILASPDIDIDLFRTQIAQLPRPFVERMYLLISQDDYALRLSRRIAGGVPRVGAADAAELENLGVTVIDLSEIDDTNAGSHSKFAGSPEVVQLIGAGLNGAGRFDEGMELSLDQVFLGVPIRIFGD